MARYLNYTPNQYQSTFVPRNVEGYQKMLETMQGRYDKATEIIASTKDAILGTEFIDKAARDKFVGDVNTQVKSVYDKWQGDIGRGASDVLQLVGNVKSSDWWQTNKAHVEATKEYKAMQAKLGADFQEGINPQNVSILNPDGSYKKPNEVKGSWSDWNTPLTQWDAIYGHIATKTTPYGPVSLNNGLTKFEHIKGLTEDQRKKMFEGESGDIVSKSLLSTSPEMNKTLIDYYTSKGATSEQAEALAIERTKNRLVVPHSIKLVQGSEDNYRDTPGWRSNKKEPWTPYIGNRDIGTTDSPESDIGASTFTKQIRKNNKVNTGPLGDMTTSTGNLAPKYGGAAEYDHDAIVKNKDKIDAVMQYLPDAYKNTWNTYLKDRMDNKNTKQAKPYHSSPTQASNVDALFNKLTPIFKEIEKQKKLNITSFILPTDEKTNLTTQEGLTKQMGAGIYDVSKITFDPQQKVFDPETKKIIPAKEWKSKFEEGTSYKVVGRLGPQNPLAFEDKRFINGLTFEVGDKTYVMSSGTNFTNDNASDINKVLTQTYQKTLITPGIEHPVFGSSDITVKYEGKEGEPSGEWVVSNYKTGQRFSTTNYNESTQAMYKFAEDNSKTK